MADEQKIRPRRDQYGHGRARDVQMKVWLQAAHRARLDALAQHWHVSRTEALERLIDEAAAQAGIP